MTTKRKRASGSTRTHRRAAPRTAPVDLPSADWRAFATRLAVALDTLAEDHFLILAVKGQHRFVQFATGGSEGIRAECVSNQYLEAEERLTPKDHRALSALGWNAPDRKAVGSGTEGGNPHGSSNWYKDFEMPVDYEALTAITVATFVSVYGIADPGQLEYQAFHSAGARVVLPALGIPAAPPAVSREPSLTQKVVEAAAAASEEPMRKLDDSTWLLSVSGVDQFLVVLELQSVARVIMPIGAVDDLTASLAMAINEMNARVMPFGFVYCRDGEVRYAAELLLEPFVPEQVRVWLERAAAGRRLVAEHVRTPSARDDPTVWHWRVFDPAN